MHSKNPHCNSMESPLMNKHLTIPYNAKLIIEHLYSVYKQIDFEIFICNIVCPLPAIHFLDLAIVKNMCHLRIGEIAEMHYNQRNQKFYRPDIVSHG